MKYYIQTIEQIKKNDALEEYAKIESYTDYNTAYSKFFEKLMNVSNDLGKNHTYLNIKMMVSDGTEIDRKTIGAYDKGDEEPVTVNVSGVNVQI